MPLPPYLLPFNLLKGVDFLKQKCIVGFLFLCILFIIISCVGCGETVEFPPQPGEAGPADNKEIQKPVNIGVLQGPTGMGIVHLMDDSNYNIEIVGSPDVLIGKIVTGEVDLAAVPSNLAAILYERSGQKIELLAINTLGVLYVLEDGKEVNSIADLAGKTLYVSGKGATPDFAIQYLLKKHGLEVGKDVILDFSTQHADLASMLVAGRHDLALLPQPHVTSVLMQNQNFRIALDLTKEWKGVTGSELPMGVIVAQKEFIENNKDALLTFLEKYEQSIQLVNNNIAKSAALIAEHNILPNPEVAEQAIPFCNIVYIDAANGRAYLEDFFNILFEFSPDSIGGKIPDDGFYFVP